MTLHKGLTLSTCFIAVLGATSAQALIIDDFDTDASVAVLTASPSTLIAATADSGAGMIGDRTMTVGKTAGGAGGANGAFADIIGGTLAMANGPVTNSIVTLDWVFTSTDLTEGGTKTGIFLALPDPIDNDLTIDISINGGTASSILFLDGSSGVDFYFPFIDFVNEADAASATSLQVRFVSGNAWDAQVEYIESSASVEISSPASLGLIGMSVAGLGWSRRRRNAV